MERDIFLFRPLKGRYVWLAPVMYVTALALFVGPLLSKIGVFSYTVGLLFVLLSFSIAALFLLVEMIVFLRIVLLKGLDDTSFHLSSICLALFVFLVVLLQLLPALDKPNLRQRRIFILSNLHQNVIFETEPEGGSYRFQSQAI